MQTSRRGKMAFVTLDDGRDQPEIVIFNETFDANRHLLREDAVLVAEVKVQQRVGDDGQVQGLRIIADAVYDLAGARRKWARALRLSCNGVELGAAPVRPDRAVSPRHCPVTINYRNQASGGDIELRQRVARQSRRASARRPARMARAGERDRRLLDGRSPRPRVPVPHGSRFPTTSRAPAACRGLIAPPCSTTSSVATGRSCACRTSRGCSRPP